MPFRPDVHAHFVRIDSLFRTFGTEEFMGLNDVQKLVTFALGNHSTIVGTKVGLFQLDHQVLAQREEMLAFEGHHVALEVFKVRKVVLNFGVIPDFV